MQVRIANRQDEPEIRTFVDSLYQASGSTLNLESSDSDLRNIEANYFGKEGLFLVAEDEGKIVGIAGARKKTESILEVKRLTAGSSDRFITADLLKELLAVIVEFAPRLLYERVDFAAPSKDQEQLLLASGFAPVNGQGSLSRQVTPDF